MEGLPLPLLDLSLASFLTQWLAPLASFLAQWLLSLFPQELEEECKVEGLLLHSLDSKLPS